LYYFILILPNSIDLPWESKNGAAHMCGHDGHMTCLLGAAQLIYLLKGNLKIMDNCNITNFKDALLY
jgi:metal-dependent amidase/aminoacylase/carboxypeptidase family protein